MTDLARLMNPDDDQDDPVTISRPNIPAPRPISHQHHYLAQPTSGFGNSGQRSRSFPHISISSLQNPATPTPQPSTPPPPPPPATTATSSTVSTTSTTSTAPRPPRRRRYSLTNTVTIDVPYVPCPPGMSPPHYPVPTSPEPGMRLTPVTRRPSKAKKGLAVHSCEECPKTFTRAEHLRRHKLSHQPPKLNCPFRGCNKTFHRKDLLERHQARHASHGPAPPNLPRGPGLAMPSGYNSQTLPQASLIANRPREAWPTVPRSTEQSQSRPSSMDYRTNRQNFDHDIQPPTPENYTPDFTQPEVSAPMDVVMRDVSTPIPSQDSPGGPSSSDESPYTPSNTSGPSQQRPEIYNTDWSTVYNSPTIMPTTSTMLSVGPIIPIHSPPFGPLAQPNFPEGLGIIPPYEDPGIELEGMNNIAFDGIFPRLPMAQPSETMVATAALHPGQGGYNTACGQEQLAMFDYTRTPNPVPAPLTQEDIKAIPAYLDVYWQKFDALIPIIHKATFEDTTEIGEDDIDTLRCAMAAVATNDFDGREHRVRGEKLYNHASYKARVFAQVQGRRSVPLEQAMFLCEYYARFRGRDKESYLQSPTAVSLYQRAFNYVSNNHRQPQLWREWIKFESWRRLLSACFLLDVHVARYYEQHYVHIQGLDYSSPRTLPIPLTSSTNGAWDAPDSETWRKLRPARFLKALSTLHWDVLDASELSSMPTFDSAILLAAHSLELASRLHPDRVELVEQSVRVQPAVTRIDSLFPESGVANAYLALHYTPLYCLLAVSGESWVFNRKILDHELFKSYKSTLRQWRSSGNAAVATVFATRGLKAFLALDSEQSGSNLGTEPDSVKSGVSWMNLSDYWGIYVCVLVCWAFGHAGKRQDENEPPSLDSAKQWISQVARMEPGHVRNWSRRHEAHGVVAVGREILAKDCLGGGRLFPDAVRVLEKLEQGASWTWVSANGTGRG